METNGSCFDVVGIFAFAGNNCLIWRWVGIGICRGRLLTGEGIRDRPPGIAGEAEEREADPRIRGDT